MTIKEMTEDVIQHWTRMIRWVKKQPKNEEADDNKMQVAINENWQGGKCAFCNNFLKCINCIIHKHYETSCHYIGWYDIEDSETWDEWLKHAIPFHTKLKTLRRKV